MDYGVGFQEHSTHSFFPMSSVVRILRTKITSIASSLRSDSLLYFGSRVTYSCPYLQDCITITKNSYI
uniref:Uncharacterized protein n=1 Tax=Arion vulgaris TaxID=1028688 RepID=A0A0B6ZH17_9EUPU